MKQLKDYLECDATTSANTIGAGNPMPPGPNGEVGSGDIFIRKKKKKK